jgi:signal transduction histidine kinase
LTPEQLGRLQLVAAQAAISLETTKALEDERTRASQLAELERSRREFMQIASHELRTPLTVIRGYASLLEEGSLGQLPERARAALATLIDKSGEMRAMVERMLFLARLEEGRPAYNMRPLDVVPMVREAVSRVEPQLTLRHGAVRVDLANEPLLIRGDAERLATSLDNLLQNAAKFSQGPPEVEVSVHRADGQVEIVVADHGIGVPAGSINRLFEKFYRVDDPRLRNVGGTGIGLYMVRQVVEGHQGTISVGSQVDQGTWFTIRFPLVPDGAARATTDLRAASARTPPPASPAPTRKDG